MDRDFDAEVRIEAWPDPVIDRLGLAPTSAYFEWTGNVGIFERCEFRSWIGPVGAPAVSR